MPYAIFTSYATIDGKAFKRAFEKFCRAVCAEVSVRVQTRRNLVCFVDHQGIQGGDDWRGTLADVVREAEVLVCLVSPRFVESEWCGREFEVFRRRVQRWRGAPGSTRRFIFPLLWEASAKRVPDVITCLQFHGFTETSEAGGLRALTTNGRRPQFNDFVRRLGDLIVDTLDQADRLPTYDPIADYEAVPSAFHLPPPQRFDLAVINTLKKPEAYFGEAGAGALANHVDKVGGRLPFAATVIARKDASADFAVTAARLQHPPQIGVAIVDALADPTDPLLDSLNGFAALEPGVIVLHAEGQPPPVLSDWITLFPGGPFAKALSQAEVAAASPSELETKLEILATRMRTRLIQASVASKVSNAVLSEAAQKQGVAVDVRPLILGPG